MFEGLSFQTTTNVERLRDNYEDFRKVYSPSVIASRRDLQAEEQRIIAEIKAAETERTT